MPTSPSEPRRPDSFWPRAETWLIVLIAIHSYAVGFFLLFLTQVGCGLRRLGRGVASLLRAPGRHLSRGGGDRLSERVFPLRRHQLAADRQDHGRPVPGLDDDGGRAGTLDHSAIGHRRWSHGDSWHIWYIARRNKSVDPAGYRRCPGAWVLGGRPQGPPQCRL